jgi:predicted RNA binding protein YcfA (HicA-like mRNA interferase family)
MRFGEFVDFSMTFWSNERESIMAFSDVTFGQFDAVMHQLGFKKTLVRGSHVNYIHPESGAILLAQLHKPNDLVPTYVLFGARVDLENQGVIDREEFLKMLESVAA